jgi:hypothetical protein
LVDAKHWHNYIYIKKTCLLIYINELFLYLDVIYVYFLIK